MSNQIAVRPIVQPLYKNRDWLYDEYVNRKKNIYQIEEEFNMGHTTVHKWLKKHDIPIRTKGEGNALVKSNHFVITKEFIEFIDGELLGDMGIYQYSSYSAYIGYSSRYKEYLKWLSGILANYGIKQTGSIFYNNGADKRTGKCYEKYFFNSRTYPELLESRKRWYPNGKKIVPEDIELTPLVCRQWYIGDGCLHKIKSRYTSPFISFSVEGFDIEYIEQLFRKLEKIGFIVTMPLNGNRRRTIRLSSKSTLDFLSYIGDCPVDCYRYKWDINRR